MSHCYETTLMTQVGRNFPLKLCENEMYSKWIISLFVVQAGSKQQSRVQSINHESHKIRYSFILGGIFFQTRNNRS